MDLDDLQHLIDTLPEHKLQAATKDLHFDWSNLDKLTKGQLKILSKRLYYASFKTKEEFTQLAEQSELIQDMRSALARFRKGLQYGYTGRDDCG